MRPLLGLAALALMASIRVGSAADDKEKKEPPKVELTDDEKLIIELTNKERAKENLPPLKVNPILCSVARAHSTNMAKQEKIDHNLDGKTPGMRTKEGGYNFEVCGENLGKGNKPYTVKLLMKDWMNSKDHREHILEKEFTEIGVGIMQTDKGDRYFTQLFAAPFKD
jgi:uncharacterized protein YkwD